MLKILLMSIALMLFVIIVYGDMAKFIESTATQNTYQESGQ